MYYVTRRWWLWTNSTISGVSSVLRAVYCSTESTWATRANPTVKRQEAVVLALWFLFFINLFLIPFRFLNFLLNLLLIHFSLSLFYTFLFPLFLFFVFFPVYLSSLIDGRILFNLILFNPDIV